MTDTSGGPDDSVDRTDDVDREQSKEALQVWDSVTTEIGTRLVDLIDWCNREVPPAPAPEQERATQPRWRPLLLGVNDLDGQAVALLREAAQLFLGVIERAVEARPTEGGRWSTLIGTPLGDALNSTRSVLNFLRQWREKVVPPEVRTANALAGVEAFTTALRATNGLISWARENLANVFDVLNKVTQLDDNRFRLATEESARRMEQFERTAEERSSAIASVETAVRASAGVVAEGSTAQVFSDYAIHQGKAGGWWLAASVALLGVVAAVGVLLLHGSEQRNWQNVVAHLIVAGPAAGLAAYAARESSRRRESAERARHVATQLKTIDAYSAQLPEDQARDLLAHFGRYLYGPYTLPGDNLLHSLPPEVLDAAASALRK